MDICVYRRLVKRKSNARATRVERLRPNGKKKDNTFALFDCSKTEALSAHAHCRTANVVVDPTSNNGGPTSHDSTTLMSVASYENYLMYQQAMNRIRTRSQWAKIISTYLDVIIRTRKLFIRAKMFISVLRLNIYSNIYSSSQKIRNTRLSRKDD